MRVGGWMSGRHIICTLQGILTKETAMDPILALTMIFTLAAAGWAGLVTLVAGGGIGMFLILFVVLKLLGK